MRRGGQRRWREPDVDVHQVRLGVAWYDRDQWARLREVAADPNALEETYEDWVAMTERAIRTVEAAGEPVARVPIDTEELVLWCNEQKRPVDGPATAEFASRKLYERRRAK